MEKLLAKTQEIVNIAVRTESKLSGLFYLWGESLVSDKILQEMKTADIRLRALRKMIAKNCDLLVLNGPSAIDSTENEVEIFLRPGKTIARLKGSKTELGREIFALVEEKLIK